MMIPLRIGTRGSPLALWQAHHITTLLHAVAPQQPVELIEIQTTGDQVREVPLSQVGGDGLFTKEIQRALQLGTVDVAVHSLKDLPTFAVEGLLLAAVPRRGPTGDALVSRRHRSFADLPAGAVVATGSLRRRAQLLYRRPDLQIVNIRGNVETRLRKLDEPGLDATILAQAGLERLGLHQAITEILDASWMLPAIGQGALGLECRAEDVRARELLKPLNDAATRGAVLAERALLRGLGGGCQVPIGAATAVMGARLTLRGVVIDVDGKRRIEASLEGGTDTPEELGQRLAEQLLALGARELLKE